MIVRSLVLVAAAAAIATGGAARTTHPPFPGAGKPDVTVVHGMWTVVVRSSKGEIVGVSHFENELQNGGQIILAEVLAGTATPGRWLIGWSKYPVGYQGTRDSNSGKLLVASAVVKYAAGKGLSTPYVRLTATDTATYAASITSVNTTVGYCGPAHATASCKDDLGARVFTAKGLDTPISVAVGQIVQFTVDLTFS